jgi:hypothetical protein
MKRLYFLTAIAIMQIVVGSISLLGAAQPVRMSEDVLVKSGSYYHFAFGILGSGQVSGNLSEMDGRAVQVYVFDDRGFATFADGSNSVPPLMSESGTNVRFNSSLPGSGQFHIVALNLPARQQLQFHLDLVVFGLKPSETVVALIVLVGGLALVAASLMLSVWSWRRARSAPALSSDSAPSSAADPVADPLPEPVPVDPEPNEPLDDKTRIY